jgi:NTE family protein
MAEIGGSRRSDQTAADGALLALVLAGGDRLERFSLPGGAALLEEGETSNKLYILRAGRLAAIRRQPEGPPRLLNMIWPGEGIGEISLLAGIPHSASVIALRDSEIHAMSRDAFVEIASRQPAVLLELVQTIIRRSLPATSKPRGPSTFGFAAISEGIDARSFSEKLAQHVKGFGASLTIVDSSNDRQDAEWFSRLEEANDFLFYAAEPGEPEWAAICTRQSDRLFQIANGDHAPPAGPPPLAPPGLFRQSDLVLLHARSIVPPRHATAWRQRVSAKYVHHLCHEDGGDLARLARLVTGRSTAVVLSGGGARGYAHIGAIRALREHGVPIDRVGGASMGAIIAAGVALGWDDDEMEARVGDAFVASNPLADLAFPLLALTKGLQVEARLTHHFGDRDISDLWWPFFCVSSDLTHGVPVLHDRGALVPALRASIALPGVLPPARDGDTVLVDGGVMRNLPADMMRDMHDGPIIAVDVSIDAGISAKDIAVPASLLRWIISGEWRKGPPIMSLLLRSATVTAERDLIAARHMADVLIAPRLESVEIGNWKAFRPAAAAGYEATLRELEKLDRPVTELRLAGRGSV